ncbi:MAG: DNA polymerase domain-containing protein [Methanomassiliicoccales archaeon]
MNGWILDAYADEKENRIVLWIRGEGIQRHSLSYTPHFYLHGEDMHSISEALEAAGYRINLVKRRAAPSMKELQMLEVSTDDFKLFKQVYPKIYAIGRHRNFLLFDTDMPLEQRFMLERGVFPLAYVSVRGGEIECMDDAMDPEYSVPQLSSAWLDASAKGNTLSIMLNDEVFEGEAAFSEVMAELRRLDADIVLTHRGDEGLLAALYEKAAALGMENFTLGREKGYRVPYGARRYTSYGRVLHRPSPYFLNGRLHIDTANSFLFQESKLDGLFDISRLSCICPQPLSRLSPGSAISNMENNWAWTHSIAVPWKKNRPEQFKRADVLLEGDRGGLIYNPVTGFFKDVLCFDFSSLYPSIMCRENISVDTLNCDCCTGHVPGLPYHFCRKRRGIVPSVIKMLIERRRRYVKSDERAHLRRTALKWVLVTSFGYTGYRNARFGSIECHEAINAFAREVLLRASTIFERNGFSILHGIVDSLWVSGNGNAATCAAEVERETGIPFELDGAYRWIVFLSNKGNGAGSLNRYYGLLSDGSWKIRGIELRRTDTPQVVRYAQLLLLETLRNASSQEEFRALAKEGVMRVCELVHNISSGEYPLEELLITRRASKNGDEYAEGTEQHKLVHSLEAYGLHIRAGQAFTYLLADGMGEFIAKPSLSITGREKYSIAAYRKLVARAVATMLHPFGYTEERVIELFRHS